MNSMSHLNGSSDLRCLSLINRGRSAALCGDSSRSLTRGWRLDASGSAASRFWSICLRFRMRCNLKTAPNIGELSLFSAIGPNVPVLPMARRSRAPQTSGPYALCHPFPPTTPLRMSVARITLCAFTSALEKCDKIWWSNMWSIWII